MGEMNPSHVLGWVDYLLFSLVLIVTSFIGVYYAWRGTKGSPAGYLTGNKKLGVFPIAMSLAAGTLAATALLATPTDIYLTGTMHFWIVLGAFLCVPFVTLLYLPVFYELQVVSTNQYLELRFNYIVRRFASVITIIYTVLYLSIVVYGPSLALNQMTGMNVYIWVTIIFVVCTFYTSLGGFKAVVWTDTLQIFLGFGSIFTVLFKGITDVGGLDVVWQRSSASSRTEFFNIDFDPTTRQTIWSTVIGGLFLFASVQSVSQTSIQRFNAMPSIRKAIIAMFTNMLAIGSIISLCCFMGVVVYARYFDCDPVTARIIEKPDQIVPYFVLDTVGEFPGLPGLFIAGVFSGALSTLSSGLNAVALLVLEDFIRPFLPNLEEWKAVRITKYLALATGCICFAAVFLVSNVDTILDATLALSGAYGGAILGLFTLGMLVPWANAIGAGIGVAVSFILMIWLGMGAQMAKSQGFVHNQIKPFSTENCPSYLNLTTQIMALTAPVKEEDFFVLLRVSTLWYTPMGFIIVMVVGILISCVSGMQNSKLLDPRLVFKFMRKYVGSNRPEIDNDTITPSTVAVSQKNTEEIKVTDEGVELGVCKGNGIYRRRSMTASENFVQKLA